MDYKTIIIGAGAAGMMCAAHAGNTNGARGQTLVIDHAKNAGEKIRISGGGRCNFTNIYAEPSNFLSQNSHFCKSALKRYTQWDFMDLVARYGIPTHEKTLGQMFCDNSAKDIIQMLRDEMEQAGADLWLSTRIANVEKTEAGFRLSVEKGSETRDLSCANLVIASGGKSIPKMGATGFGYQIAQQFGLPLIETRAGLVPFTFGEDIMARLKPLAGIALDSVATARNGRFKEALLFTHRGLSGPAILQASSYWHESEPVTLSLLPDIDLFAALKAQKQLRGRISIANALADHMPKRIADVLCSEFGVAGNLADFSDKALQAFVDQLRNWQLTPSGTEGYRTAEVTLGGVDTDALSSKTMESKSTPGLYFIGEVVDVTGWLGGFNFQWAWSSGWAAGTAIAQKP
ncbi:BaiN/RdsA family NAD(P)/FAD-dependent oxidoreductase [Cochlodiniinecator piscidefendens]|uniref:NAD(P)/FAD-dependent oxidoreductase n=1 Tax=Cochlodiniinecator piscidefendens TaxID=2715756 RepID=UPI00140B89FC|nr:NAD(P)/FAD-dependent oxidoreductase [Cochlodiniinecator piscidefendens]